MRARLRGGFTAIELIIVMVIAGVLAGIGVPRIMTWVAFTRVDNAARAVSSDLRFAGSLAIRQGRPVRLEVDQGGMEVRIIDTTTGDALHRRVFGAGGEFSIGSIVGAPAAVTLYPDRTASTGIEIDVRAAGHGRRVTMSPAAFIQVVTL